MQKRVRKVVEQSLSSGFLAVTFVWIVAAFVVSVTPVEDTGRFRAYFPSGSSSSVASPSSVMAEPHGSADDTCSNGIDDEGDIAMDAGDPDCDTMYNICDNRVDDDGDGAVDVADPDCDGGWM